jgi:hypothetical protein
MNRIFNRHTQRPRGGDPFGELSMKMPKVRTSHGMFLGLSEQLMKITEHSLGLSSPGRRSDLLQKSRRILLSGV